MIHHPFRIFQKYRDVFDVFLFTKEENVHTDADVAESIGTTNIASLWQVHGNRTVVVRGPTERKEKADGMITDQPDLLLSIRAADCQPILVYAPHHHVVGLLHVGWRGLIPSPSGRGLGTHLRQAHFAKATRARGYGGQGGGQRTAVQSFFETLQREWSIVPSDVYVGIGPSLRQCCAEYWEPDHPLRKFPARFWKENHIDLAGIADEQLIECGVSAEHIERHPDCTRCHPEKYWTYRGGDREKVLQGYTNVLAVRLV